MSTMARAPKPFFSPRVWAFLVRLGIGLSCAVFLSTILFVIYLRRSHEHRRESERIISECRMADEGYPSGGYRLHLEYNSDGTSEYVVGGWRHVEPPLHWNDGHPNEIW